MSGLEKTRTYGSVWVDEVRSIPHCDHRTPEGALIHCSHIRHRTSASGLRTRFTQVISERGIHQHSLHVARRTILNNASQGIPTMATKGTSMPIRLGLQFAALSAYMPSKYPQSWGAVNVSEFTMYSSCATGAGYGQAHM